LTLSRRASISPNDFLRNPTHTANASRYFPIVTRKRSSERAPQRVRISFILDKKYFFCSCCFFRNKNTENSTEVFSFCNSRTSCAFERQFIAVL
jgi:hypothetical protein